MASRIVSEPDKAKGDSALHNQTLLVVHNDLQAGARKYKQDGP